MAKQKSSSYPFPRKIILDDFKGYVKVTSENKKSALIIGRACYIINKCDAKNMLIGAVIEIRPRLHKGRMQISKHPALPTFDFFCFTEESVQDYRDNLSQIFELHIKQENLYIKLGEELIKYEYI